MKTVNKLPVRELRCRTCRAFITYERILAGYIVHICPKCGEENVFTFKFLDVASNRAMINNEFTIQPKKGGD